MKLRTSAYAPIRPSPAQLAFFLAPRLEVLYGGAAGGGKSTALLADALRYCDVPGYAALLLRRTYPELTMPGGLVEKSHEWLAGRASWNGGEMRWTFPSGATLSFGHLQYEIDVNRYQSAAFNFLGFDELTTFTMRMYRYMYARARRPSSRARLVAARDGLTLDRVPIRVRAATNPGGPGHEWVKRRFGLGSAAPAGSEYAPDEHEPRAAFVRALLRDNPYLDVEEYLASLGVLTELDRRRLLAGDWDVAAAGNIFNRFRVRTISEAPPSVMRLRVWDVAATPPNDANPDPDWTVGTLWQVSDDAWQDEKTGRSVPHLDVVDVVRGRWDSDEVDAVMLSTARSDGVSTVIRVPEDPGAAGKKAVASYRRMLESEGFVVESDRESTAKDVRARPAAAAFISGRARLLASPWTNAVLSEMAAFPTRGAHDDIVDTLSAGFNRLVGYASGVSVALPPRRPISIVR